MYSKDNLPPTSPLARHWPLDPAVCFLNHGSFGACPASVLEAQDRHRAAMEAEPIRFMVELLPAAMDRVRAALSRFVGCDEGGLVMVPNATTGVATVLANLSLRPGDEVLVNTHEYAACLNCARRAAERAGAKLVRAELPWPVEDEDQIVNAVLSCVTDLTRIALISHVTSPSALILPVGRIVQALRERGVETIVDGAHAPGLCELDIASIGAAYYTGNCHKWLCAPKGAAFLHVREDFREGFRPLVLSVYANAVPPGRPRLHAEFDYIGADDYTAYLSVPDAIEAVGAMVPGGWAGVRGHNRQLAQAGRDLVCRGLGVEPPVPDALLGPMATIDLPPHPPELAERLRSRPTMYADALQEALIAGHGVQVPILWLGDPPRRAVRLSAQLYNSLEQYAYLAGALREELERERRSG